MTPKTRAALFAVPLVSFVVVLALVLPNLPQGSPRLVLVPAGTVSLAEPGSWTYGVVYTNTSFPVVFPDHWVEFHAYLNDTADWRITGAWNATTPTMVVVSWGVLWTPNATLRVSHRGCPASPAFCLGSLLLTSTQGRLDFTLNRTNDLCWDPDGGQWACVYVPGGGVQGVDVYPGLPTYHANGTVSVSVTFVAPWYPGKVTVLEPFVLERVGPS